MKNETLLICSIWRSPWSILRIQNEYGYSFQRFFVFLLAFGALETRNKAI